MWDIIAGAFIMLVGVSVGYGFGTSKSSPPPVNPNWPLDH